MTNSITTIKTAAIDTSKGLVVPIKWKDHSINSLPS